jgi:hypothetical protein
MPRSSLPELRLVFLGRWPGLETAEGKTMNRYKLDNYKRRYTIDAYECEHCTMPGTQIAHRIAETKTNLAKYGVKVVNHFFNLVVTCSLYCNSRFNIGNNPRKCDALAELIRQHGGEVWTAAKITKEIERKVQQ